jgi:Flp pilus assembly protein TadG
MSRRFPSFRRLGRDRSGAAAVEFALIAPVLIGLYFGMAEYCQAMLADRKATHVASAVGDLVSQSESVTAAEVDQILEIGPALMAPFKADSATNPLKVRVTLVSKDLNGVVTKPWSRYTAAAPAAFNVADLPTTGAAEGQPFLANGQSIIVTQTEYSYTSPFNLTLVKKLMDKNATSGPTTYTFKEVFYLRPRRGGTIPCTGCSAG